MPFGFDDGAAVVGLVIAFQGCIAALIVLSEARSYGRDVSGVRLMVEIEKHKLYTWASEVGLLQSPPALKVSTEHAHLVPKILKHLYNLLSDLNKLKDNYDLSLQETAEEIVSLDQYGSAFERLSLDQDESSRSMQRKIFKDRKNPWKVLKWISFDEQRIRKLIDQVRSFTSELQRILDQTRQTKMDGVIDAIMRNAVLNTGNEQDLDMMGMGLGEAPSLHAIAAAARFKKNALLLGVMDVEQTASLRKLRSRSGAPQNRSWRSSSQTLIPRYSASDLTPMRLSSHRLRVKLPDSRPVRMLAYYDRAPVMLEFRGETELDHSASKDRLFKVAAFLQDLDSSFHGLSCRGYVKTSKHGYAYVFDMPAQAPQTKDSSFLLTRTTSPKPPSFRTLRRLYDLPMPSVNTRLSIAIVALEVLLQLHTSGWLHKELRSENVLFFHQQTSGQPIDASMLEESPYIAGYVHARADDPHEATEPLESELEADLYRHPASLGASRKPYCKAFDMFSIGCLLLELGLWRAFPTMLRLEYGTEHVSGHLDLLKLRHENLLRPIHAAGDLCQRKSVSNVDLGGILDSLASRMGVKYTIMVVALLRAWDIESASSEVAMSEADKNKCLLGLEMDCLERLRTMAQVL